MGTHPIFESDFDCLTEEQIDKNGIFRSSSTRTGKVVHHESSQARYSTTYEESLFGINADSSCSRWWCHARQFLSSSCESIPRTCWQSLPCLQSRWQTRIN